MPWRIWHHLAKLLVWRSERMIWPPPGSPSGETIRTPPETAPLMAACSYMTRGARPSSVTLRQSRAKISPIGLMVMTRQAVCPANGMVEEVPMVPSTTTTALQGAAKLAMASYREEDVVDFGLLEGIC